MTFQICTLILTFMLGTLGVYSLIILRSVRKLTEETRQSLIILNQDLPEILFYIKEGAQKAEQVKEQGLSKA